MQNAPPLDTSTMKMEERFAFSVLLLLCATSSTNGENILVWYTEGSHWINMKPVLETLVDRGHMVTVLVPSSSLFINSSEPSHFGYEPFPVSVSKEEMEKLYEEYFHFSMYEMDHLSYLQIYIKYMDLMRARLQFSLKSLDGVLKSETLMTKMKNAKYDLLFSDPVYLGSDLLADILDVPLRFSPAHNWERYCAHLPAPPSFVPGAMSKLTDKMDFSERLWNFLFYVLQDLVMYDLYWKEVNRYYTDFRGTPTSACEMMGKADLWLMRTYWDFDFPRPILPNFKFVGGIHCRPARPLPEDMEEFVQSSGDAGIVVFSLGSFVKNITAERGNMIASALAQIPQKVRYKENAMRLSSIHHDRPMKPLDEAVFWIEYTMRNKGAKHLRVQAHKLTWYQYHSLDVMAFLLTIVLFLMFIFFKTCWFCFRRCCGRPRNIKRKTE